MQTYCHPREWGNSSLLTYRCKYILNQSVPKVLRYDHKDHRKQSLTLPDHSNEIAVSCSLELSSTINPSLSFLLL